MVVGSSNWIANNILRFNGNRDLFLNMMNWLSSDEDLISIRPKEPEDRRLTLSKPADVDDLLFERDRAAADRDRGGPDGLVEAPMKCQGTADRRGRAGGARRRGLLVGQSEETAEEKEPAKDAPPKILTIPDDQFKSIQSAEDAAAIPPCCRSRTRASGRLRSRSRCAADQDAVGSLVSALASLTSDRLIEDKATDLAQLRAGFAQRSKWSSRRRTARPKICWSATTRRPAAARSSS